MTPKHFLRFFSRDQFNVILKKAGFLLIVSALLSKILGLLRDRLLSQHFSPAETDLIFTAFRIPDFFFYLFVGATISTLLIPRLSELPTQKDKNLLISSFFWKICVFFGGISLIAFFSADFLTSLINQQDTSPSLVHLTQYLFLSVFILSISGLFSAANQASHKFLMMSIAPLLYMGSICIGIFLFSADFGLPIVGMSAIAGATLHLLINLIDFYRNQGRMFYCWNQPTQSWKNFAPDFGRRVLNNSIFQINLTLDIYIASFLLTGAITAFSIGSNLGHFLLSIIGFSLANASFPKLTDAKHNYPQQIKIINRYLKLIFMVVIPASLFCAIFSESILRILFNQTPEILHQTKIVFFWTVLSLPAACIIPILSRFFLANDDTKTPLKLSFIALFIATSLAATLALVILPKEQAILGLALGNFTANLLSASLLAFFVYRPKNYQSPQ